MEDGYLTGWKAIANFLDVSVGTAKKYYKNHGMPIQRTPSKRPCCLPEYINEWLVLNKPNGYVYFIQAENNGLIKIGFSQNLKKGFAILRNSSPVKITLLATQSGTIQDEVNYHERFKKYRKHGEWFEPKKIILNCISKIIYAYTLC